MKRLLIAAGGTGGHIFPAMAVADIAKENNIDVLWLGTRGRMEERLVPDKFAIEYINMKALRGKGLLAKLLGPFRLLHAIWQSIRWIRLFKPDCFLSMGGFVAAPAGIAAWLMGVPIVVHEQNAVAGMTNKLLARLAKRVCQAFSSAFPVSEKVLTVGNPVRSHLTTLPDVTERIDTELPLHVLIIGGSQGARAINQSMVAMMQQYDLPQTLAVWHQTGRLDAEYVQHASTDWSNYRTETFINDIAEAYVWADVVVCRAGALTVSELAAVGLASILVPLPSAVDDHQTANARQLVDHQAALLLPQSQLNAQTLHAALQALWKDKTLCVTMGQKAQASACHGAAQKVYNECENVGSKRD